MATRGSGPGPAQSDIALTRYRLLRPALEEEVPLARLAREAGIPLRTAQRWVATYRRRGLAALARGSRADAGRSRGVPDQLRQFVEGLALQRPRRSLAAIQRLAVQVAEGHGWSAPSYDQVRAIVRQLDPALLILAHEGTVTYAETDDLLHRHTARRPNAIWQADHRPLPVHLHGAEGTTVRPWLTIIEDDDSRAVAGYRLSLTGPTALQTALAFRAAIWRSGARARLSAASRRRSTPITAATSPPGTSSRSPPT